MLMYSVLKPDVEANPQWHSILAQANDLAFPNIHKTPKAYRYISPWRVDLNIINVHKQQMESSSQVYRRQYFTERSKTTARPKNKWTSRLLNMNLLHFGFLRDLKI